MICPNCGKENEQDARFCNACGLRLEKPEEQAASVDNVMDYKVSEHDKEPEFDYDAIKRDRSLSSFAISLFFPAVVLTILLLSYLYTYFNM